MAKIIKLKIEKNPKKPLTSFQKKLLNAPVMSDEEFKNHKHNIINNKLEKLKNLDSEID